MIAYSCYKWQYISITCFHANVGASSWPVAAPSDKQGGAPVAAQGLVWAAGQALADLAVQAGPPPGRPRAGGRGGGLAGGGLLGGVAAVPPRRARRGPGRTPP